MNLNTNVSPNMKKEKNKKERNTTSDVHASLVVSVLNLGVINKMTDIGV